MRALPFLSVVVFFLLSIFGLLCTSFWGLVVFSSASERACCLPDDCEPSLALSTLKSTDVPYSSTPRLFCDIPLELAVRLNCRQSVFRLLAATSNTSICNTTSPADCMLPANRGATQLAVAAAICGIVSSVVVLFATMKQRIVDGQWSTPIMGIGFALAAACCALSIIALNDKTTREVVVTTAADTNVFGPGCPTSLAGRRPQQVQVTTPNFAAPLAVLITLSGVPVIVFILAGACCGGAANPFDVVHFWWKFGSEEVEQSLKQDEEDMNNQQQQKQQNATDPFANVAPLVVKKSNDDNVGSDGEPLDVFEQARRAAMKKNSKIKRHSISSEFHPDYADSLDESSSQQSRSPIRSPVPPPPSAAPLSATAAAVASSSSDAAATRDVSVSMPPRATTVAASSSNPLMSQKQQQDLLTALENSGLIPIRQQNNNKNERGSSDRSSPSPIIVIHHRGGGGVGVTAVPLMDQLQQQQNHLNNQRRTSGGGNSMSPVHIISEYETDSDGMASRQLSSVIFANRDGLLFGGNNNNSSSFANINNNNMSFNNNSSFPSLATAAMMFGNNNNNNNNSTQQQRQQPAAAQHHRNSVTVFSESEDDHAAASAPPPPLHRKDTMPLRPTAVNKSAAATPRSQAMTAPPSHVVSPDADSPLSPSPTDGNANKNGAQKRHADDSDGGEAPEGRSSSPEHDPFDDL